MIKLNQMTHAHALAAHGNFRRAAISLNISQPALSRSIGKLEENLGVLLFDRQTDGVTPTVFGEVLLKFGEPILAEVEELERQVNILQKLEAGQFSVSLAPAPAVLSGPMAITELLRLHPNLRCRANVRLWHLVVEEVIERRVDLGICELSILDHSDTRLSVEALPSHEAVLYCRKGHPVCKKSKISKADLDTYPLASPILPPRAAKIFPGMTELDRSTGYLVPSVEIDDLELARRIVEGSNTISWNTPIQLEPWLNKGTIEIIPYRGPWLRLNYGFVFLRQRMFSPATELFMQLVRDFEEDLAIRNKKLMKQLF
jgi:DNA-binding transcriptional LysR family regulator